MRYLLTLIALCIALAPVTAGAQTMTKEARINTYVRFGDANIRIDKIESVRHVDGNPIIDVNSSAFDPDGDLGYVIVSVSVQNPGNTEIFMPTFHTILFLEDQSKVESDFLGPYVGSKTVEAPSRLSAKESLRVRYVVPQWPGTRITKMILDPNSGAPQLRFQIGAGDITPLPEIKRAKTE